MIRMNVLNDMLDGLSRWYVAIPPFLIVAFLAALFLVTGLGEARLQHASERLQKSSAREHGIDELQVSLANAISAQRGFLLTGDNKFVDVYNQAVGAVEPQL